MANILVEPISLDEREMAAVCVRCERRRWGGGGVDDSSRDLQRGRRGCEWRLAVDLETNI